MASRGSSTSRSRWSAETVSVGDVLVIFATVAFVAAMLALVWALEKA
ncbi:MAG: hypothetical protein ACRDWE_01115 [Acidimicrobiales bacterium]